MNKVIFLLTIILLATYSCSNKGKNNNNTNSIAAEDIETVSDENSMHLLVGTYTGGESEGIYVYQFDTVSGYSHFRQVTKIDNPSYLTLSKDEKFVYAVSEDSGEKATASAFSFDKKDGSLKLLNSQKTGGDSPCYIEVDKNGKHVITANYGGGSITQFGVKDDGSLNLPTQVIRFMGKGTDTERQTKPYLHCVRFSPDGNYLFADDLGTDKIHKFDVKAGDADNFLQVGTPPFFKVADGSGPRHLTFHPNGKYAYLINELSGAVIAFSYDSQNGNLAQIQSIQADTLNAKGSGDIHVSPDGKFLYASNRLKGDGIAIFSINQADGKLTKAGYQETGIHPRNFVISPNGKFLLVASRDSDMIQIFLRNQSTGLLEDTFQNIKLDMPVCLKFAAFK